MAVPIRVTSQKLMEGCKTIKTSFYPPLSVLKSRKQAGKALECLAPYGDIYIPARHRDTHAVSVAACREA